MNVWRLVCHHGNPERALTEYMTEGKIALGWNCAGDLREIRDPREITQKVKATANPNWPFAAKQLLNFANELNEGDLVILSASGSRRAVMKVTGQYRYVPNLDDNVAYAHQRDAVLTNLNANDVWRAAGGRAPGHAVYWAFVKCARALDR